MKIFNDEIHIYKFYCEKIEPTFLLSTFDSVPSPNCYIKNSPDFVGKLWGINRHEYAPIYPVNNIDNPKYVCYGWLQSKKDIPDDDIAGFGSNMILLYFSNEILDIQNEITTIFEKYNLNWNKIAKNFSP